MFKQSVKTLEYFSKKTEYQRSAISNIIDLLLLSSSPQVLAESWVGPPQSLGHSKLEKTNERFILPEECPSLQSQSACICKDKSVNVQVHVQIYMCVSVQK